METNKILGAIILALLLLALFSKTGEMLVHPNFPEETAYKIDVPEEGSQAKSTEEIVDPFEVLPDVILLLQTASLENGQKLSKKCSTCHSFDSGGANKAGPNLWNLINRKKASKEGFAYSAALTEFGGEWSYSELNKFLLKPKKYIKGTKMNFNGLKKDSDRADLIIWLRSLSDTPELLK
jgi:cytochrome c|tara:strand:+ start:764 stop:1303 length:540 start_codon:yes stop_codon:yes gene_type:complete